MLAGHVVGFLDFFMDFFLEVQDKKYSQILYLIEYIAYGVHLCIKKTSCRNIENHIFWQIGCRVARYIIQQPCGQPRHRADAEMYRSVVTIIP